MIGETVTVRLPSGSEADEGGNLIPVWSDQQVDNVLVAPGQSADVNDSNRPDGVQAVYELHFPKSFTGNVANAHVVVRGEEFMVMGDPRPYTDSLTPGSWNRMVGVRAVNG